MRTAYAGPTDFPELTGEQRADIAARIRQKYGLRGPFLLFVGTLEKRKNVATLARAFARVAEKHDLQLVLVGRPGFGFVEIDRSLRLEGCRGRCVTLAASGRRAARAAAFWL